MFGEDVIDSDWTALRSPPLLHFSGAQPSSPTTGRSTFSEASSQMKAAKASRVVWWPETFQGAFMMPQPPLLLEVAFRSPAPVGVLAE